MYGEKAESFISTYFTFSLMWLSPTPSSYTKDGQVATMKFPSRSSGSSWPRKLLEGTVRRRGGCNGALIKPLPLSHFPVKKPATSHKQHRGRYWYQKRSDTHWYCQGCGVWLCHTGIENTDCFLSWHKNII